jgi:hypothetical protein
MRKTTLVSLLAAGLALLPASGAFAAAPDPYPTRESKLLVDFESTITAMSDPLNTGQNHASISTDAQFAAQGAKSLKLDLKDVSGWTDPEYTIVLPAPVDIKGYQVLSMDVFIPDASINTSSWYQFDPRTTTTDPADASMTVVTGYGPGNMHSGWNHLMWTLKNGTDTKISQISFAGNSGDAYTGPVYVDNIRVYKGNFVGLQPDEKLIFGFDKPTDKDYFTSLGGSVKVDVNTDKQFISEGDNSLKIDLTGQPSGWTSDVARVDDWGKTIDASKATAIHLDFFIPPSSYTATDYHELGFGVVGDGGEVWGFSDFVTDGQWVAMEIPLTPDQAKMLTNVKGIFFITNSGSDWTGPIYIDNLRAVVPAQ